MWLPAPPQFVPVGGWLRNRIVGWSASLGDERAVISMLDSDAPFQLTVFAELAPARSGPSCTTASMVASVPNTDKGASSGVPVHPLSPVIPAFGAAARRSSVPKRWLHEPRTRHRLREGRRASASSRRATMTRTTRAGPGPASSSAHRREDRTGTLPDRTGTASLFRSTWRPPGVLGFCSLFGQSASH